MSSFVGLSFLGPDSKESRTLVWAWWWGGLCWIGESEALHTQGSLGHRWGSVGSESSLI